MNSKLLAIYPIIVFSLFFAHTITGLFALIYSKYSKKINVYLVIENKDFVYISQIIILIFYYFGSLISIRFLGIFGWIILILLISCTILIRRYIKNNLSKIESIDVASINLVVNVTFKSKLLTLLLSPFSNIAVVIVIFAPIFLPFLINATRNFLEGIFGK